MEATLDLNPEQQSAVTAGEGPLLVLAGAGSGKTRVLTTRIGHLIQESDVPAYRILAFTFTNKAAREMRSRVETALGEESSGCWIGTFHGTGVRILRREASRLGWEGSFVIYDSADTEALLKELLGRRTTRLHVSPMEVRSGISAWKNDRVSPEAARLEASNPREQVLAELYDEYMKALRAHNAFDFDDLIARPVELFESDPELLEKYASRFLHVLVDEFQDTNVLQMQFIEQLASRHGNLFVVGDDDQSIYGWRGARIRNILEFESRFTGTRVFRLEQNYRSTPAILEAANRVISNNRGRKGKNLWTARQGGEPIRVLLNSDEEEEGVRVVQLVQEWVSEGGSRSDVAVLYRTNAQSRALEDALRRHNVPYQIVGGTRFYERREVRDILAYLKALHNPQDGLSLRRTLNVPRRGIGDTTVSRLRETALERGWSLSQTVQNHDELGLGRGAAGKIASYARLMDELRGIVASSTCVQVVQAVLESTKYLAYLQASDPGNFEARRENVEELVSAAQGFAEISDDPSLGAFLEEISLLTDIDSLQDNVDTVTLMTLHSAKGLEFRAVCVTGLEENLLPHASSQAAAADLEEERRLFYVGMTRALDRLYLLAAGRRRRYGDWESMMQSRFLSELPESCVQVEGPTTTTPVRAAWSRRQDSWRSYSEGDPDSFSQEHGVESKGDRRALRSEPGESQEPETIAVGMRVRHERFGEGHVQRLEGQGETMRITVLFGRSDSRKFVARYARLIPVP